MPKQKQSRWSQTYKQQEGFTLIEVLAGIIMSTIFVLITSQAIALSVVFRVKAQRQAEALNWIQEDLEEVKFRSLLSLTATCDSTAEADGFAQALITDLNDNAAVASPRALLNRSYSMTRTLEVFDLAPYNLMTISYSVTDPDGGQELATLYTEVIPDAALQCT